MRQYGMVIIGTGEAGTGAAIELRKKGWMGPITLIGEEKLLPYERPPLSKEKLISEDNPSPTFIVNRDILEENQITLISGCRVIKIDRECNRLHLEDESIIQYEKLLLATGAKPRKFALQSSENAEMHYLRTYSDALALRSRLQAGKHVVMIGGGFIGLEVAASAIQRGCKVSLIEIGQRILGRGVPKEIADMVEERHRVAGVNFHIGFSIEKIEKNGYEQRIILSNGMNIDCDTIIVGIGAVPETTLAVESGLVVDNGISVDETLRTSDPNIYAAGDCCSFPHSLYGGQQIRLEAWRNAQDQGAHVAGNMLGEKKPFTTVPWFWSDQYELTLQVAGLNHFGDVIVSRDIGEDGKFFFHLTSEGRLVAASAIGPISKVAKNIRLSEMLIQQEARPDHEALADPSINLKKLLQK
jgi:3-phenylpropionate/trans-cinnamate dioxygenase ferredoxin reductase subunit